MAKVDPAGAMNRFFHWRPLALLVGVMAWCWLDMLQGW